MKRIGVIGYGYWGPNLVRNFMEAEDSSVSVVCDLSRDRLELVEGRYPSVTLTQDANALFLSPNVDAVAIATPVSTHLDLAMQALTAGKHVLVEKPLAETVEQCQRLIDEAEKRQLLIMVDHTFPYTGAVRKVKELIGEGLIGEVYYYDSMRVNLGLFQHDVSVIWDLAVHDLSIMDYLFDEHPVAVSSTGKSHVSGQPENVAYLTLFYSGSTIAHIHVNWLAPVKVRQTLIGGSRKMIVYDDLQPMEKIKIYDKGVTVDSDPTGVHEMRVGYRTGDMWAPKLDGGEALAKLARHFVRCIDGEEKPITSAESGTRIVKQMEAATRSLRQKGTLIHIDD